MCGNDAFAVLRTGYGISLCYTCLPKALNTLGQVKRICLYVASEYKISSSNNYINSL